jgi:uncharacterized protein with von Willebrand factor type A (vWA) domain
MTTILKKRVVILTIIKMMMLTTLKKGLVRYLGHPSVAARPGPQIYQLMKAVIMNFSNQTTRVRHHNSVHHLQILLRGRPGLGRRSKRMDPKTTINTVTAMKMDTEALQLAYHRSRKRKLQLTTGLKQPAAVQNAQFFDSAAYTEIRLLAGRMNLLFT